MSAPETRIIGLMTADFTAFHDLVAHFRANHVPFEPLTLGDTVPPHVGVVVTTAPEAPGIDFPDVIVASTPDATLEEARRALQGLGTLRVLTVGIDPGERPGFALIGDGRVLAARQLAAPEAVRGAVADAVHRHPAERVLVRIGHGAATTRDRIINALLGLGHHLEEVDETATSPPRGLGRAERDAAAARAIAMSPGEPVTARRRVVVPDGEVRDLQRRSRELSGGEVTIPRALAVEVAKGRMTLEDAVRRASLRPPPDPS